ncbi:MAG: TIGR03016 family PEP-CTERM system-associated outer membrane protein [Acidobacteriota bacterium]
MAITPRDRSSPLLNHLSCSVLAAGTFATGTVSAETLLIQPTLSVVSSAEKQVNVLGTPSEDGKPRREVITVVSPGVQILAQGAHSLIDGLIHLDVYNYGPGQQENQVVPNGHLAAQLVSIETGTGLAAAWKAEQVPRQFISNSQSGNPNNEYTKTTWYLAPYLVKPLNASTTLRARLDHALIQSTQTTSRPDGVSRPDSTATTANIALAQRATPLGYELKAIRQQSEQPDQVHSSKRQSTALAKGLYALSSELNVGLLIGRESGNITTKENDYNGKVYGWSLDWRPQDRTSLFSQVEHRFFGQAWQVDANHRMNWMALSASFSRYATTYAASVSSVTANALDQRFATFNTDPTDRAKVLADFVTGGASQLSNANDIFNQNVQIRQEASGRLTIVGRRDTIGFAAGRVDSSTVLDEQTAVPATRDYFFVGDWTHRLAPTWRVSNALRWSRQHLTPTSLDVGLTRSFGRDFSWRGALLTDLSPSAIATFGLKRRVAHTTTYGSGASTVDRSESAVFAGLDYKF